MQRLCNCSVLCRHPKSSLCSCLHYILDLMTTFGKYFGWKGTMPSKWSGKIRDIPVSYGAEVLTVNYFILSQYMHLTDRQNCDSNTVHCIACSCTVKIL